MNTEIKRYHSTSQKFIWVYLLAIIAAALAVYGITNTVEYVYYAVGAVFLIFLPMVFVFRNSYSIDKGRLMWYSSKTKRAKPSMVIAIKDLKKIEKIEKGGKVKSLKIFYSSNRSLNLQMEEAEEFANRLVEINKDLQVI